MKLRTVALLALVALPLFGQSIKYENKSYGFSVMLPSTWKRFEPGIVEANGVKENLALEALSDTSEIDVIVSDLYTSKTNGNAEYSRKEIDDSFDKDSLARFAENLVTKLKSTRQDFQLFESDVVQLDGSPAIHLRYSAQMSSVFDKNIRLMMITNYIVTKNGVMFSIWSSCKPDYYEEAKGPISDAISTFHVQAVPTSLLDAKAPQKKTGFFRNIFDSILGNIAVNAFIWIIVVVIAGIVGLGSAVRSIIKRRTKKQ